MPGSPFAVYVKERLAFLKKSQKTLAVALKVSPAYISQVLNGKKSPPDLSRPKNKTQLTTWARFLDIEEQHVVDLVRYELYRIPLKPVPRFVKMRDLFIERLKSADKKLIAEIQALETHPAETKLIRILTQIYFARLELASGNSPQETTRFLGLCDRARANLEFIENELFQFCFSNPFLWTWDSEFHRFQLYLESESLRSVAKQIEDLHTDDGAQSCEQPVPILGYITGDLEFVFLDESSENQLEYIAFMPHSGCFPQNKAYCLKVMDDSVSPVVPRNAILYVGSETWEQIKSGDLVIYPNQGDNLRYLRKIEFHKEFFVLKAINYVDKTIILHKTDIIKLDRILSIIF